MSIEQGDDRIKCVTCRHRCDGICRKKHLTAHPIALRCSEFKPLPTEHDQRTGAERWPSLTQQTELARKEDAAFAARGR